MEVERGSRSGEWRAAGGDRVESEWRVESGEVRVKAKSKATDKVAGSKNMMHG